MKDEIEMVEPKFISVDPSKCVGCSICEYACSLEKEWSFNPSRSRIRVMRLHPLFCLTMVCRFCEDAPCVLVCPRKALKQSPDGIVIVDEDLCDGCGWCLSSCKYGAITVNPEKNVVMICDLCDGEPKCVEVCTEAGYNALTIVDEGPNIHRKLYSRDPVETAKDLGVKFFGEKGEEVIE